MAKEQLIIELIAEAKTAVRNLNEYTKAAKKSSDRVGKLTKLFKSYFAEIAGGILIARKVIKVVGDLTKAYMAQEDAVASMEAALRATGEYSPILSTNLQNLAADLQNVTKFGDESTLEMAGLLQSLADLNGAGLLKTIPLVQDFATGMKIDLNTAASLVGKTLGSTTNALSRYGIVLDMTGTQQEKLAELATVINSKFGGMAEAMGKTYAGKVTILKNAYGDLKEEMGRVIKDVLNPMLPLATNIVKKITEWVTAKNNLRDAYALIKKPMEITNLNMEMEIALATQLTAAHQLKRKEIELDAAIRSIMQHGSQEYIDTLKEEIATLYKDLAAVNTAIPLIQKAIDVKEKQVVVIDDTIKRIKGETEVVIESSDAWTRWAETMKGATKEAIKGKKAVDELTESTFDAFHTAKTYTNQLKSQTTPAISNMEQAIIDAKQAMEDQSGLLTDVMTPALEQFAMDLGAAAVGAGTAGKSIKELAKNMMSGLLIAVGRQLLALAALYTLALQFGKAAIAFAAGIAAIAAGNAIANMQQGGEVKHLQTGGFGDHVPAMLEPGEVVIDKFTAQRNMPQIASMRGGEGGDRTVNLVLDGKVLSRWMWKESTNKNLTINAKAVI